MDTYICKICGHIEFGKPGERCPVCGASREDFEKGDDLIKCPADPANLTEGDKKHIPVITILKECGMIPGGGCIDAQVKVGEIEHVMQDDHYITYIDFYIDRRFIGRTKLVPQMVHPAAGLHLNVKQGRLTVIENCNLHGRWMSEANI